MTTSSPNKRSCLMSPAVWLVALMACAGFALFSFAAAPASAAFLAAPAPTQENLWGYMALPKPTYTATSVPAAPATEVPISAPVSVDVPTIVPTDAPSQMTMSIVDSSTQDSSSDQQVPAAPSYSGSKLILVDISEQHMYVYDGDTLVYSFVVSTGIGNSTRVGTFAVQDKIPNAYGSTWDLWMPNWLGIYYSHGLENGIHALPILHSGATLWAGYLGTPVSFGCIVLDTYDAKLLYDWADIGTPVKIQW